MPNQNLTDITVILDRSGSMKRLQKDTIGGFNAFLDEQKKLPGEAKLTLATFADSTQLVYDAANIQNVAALNEVSYNPGGFTAMYDAIGSRIDAAGKRFAATPEYNRPGKVLFVIMTDGEENASREYSADQIKASIEKQKTEYSWQFLFIGANIDAVLAAKNIGIGAAATLNMQANAQGTQSMYASVSSATKAYRMTGFGADFTDADRKAQDAAAGAGTP